MRELRSISDKLDYSVQISVKVSQEMALMFAHLEGSIPLYATIEDSNAYISIFLDRSRDAKLDRIFGRTTQTTKGNYEIYELEANDLIPELQMFKKITTIPSVVPGGLYLKNGYVYADFRFHNSALEKMNVVIKDILRAQNRIKLSYLGQSQGLLKTLEDINERIPLSLISFTFVPDANYIAPEMLEEKPIAEVKLFSEGMESEYDVVHYATKLGPGSPSISISGGIYESKYRTKFMRDFKGKMRKEKIPLASVLGVYHVNLLDNYLFVPTFISDHVLCMLYETAEENNDTTLKLNSFVPFNSDLNREI